MERKQIKDIPGYLIAYVIGVVLAVVIVGVILVSVASQQAQQAGANGGKKHYTSPCAYGGCHPTEASTSATPGLTPEVTPTGEQVTATPEVTVVPTVGPTPQGDGLSGGSNNPCLACHVNPRRRRRYGRRIEL